MGYALLAFVIVFLLMASGLLLLFYREVLGQRLSRILTPRSGPGLLERFRIKQTAGSLGGIAESIRKSAPGQERPPVIQRRLMLAGYRQNIHLKVFSTAKVAVPVVLVVLAAVTGLYRWNAFLVFAAAGGLGYLLPDYWLDYRIRARARAIQEGLPDLLDLMVVCLEAGLSIDQATIRSSDEMSFSHPAIADELSLVMLEVRAGQTRVVAWQRLAERTDVEAVRMLVTILIQADQFGTGISRTLRVHSDTMRTRRRQKVEELANKTAVKLVFPLALFIFPSFFIVVLGPAAILIADAFSHMPK
jgi:tight adherence protein C